MPHSSGCLICFVRLWTHFSPSLAFTLVSADTLSTRPATESLSLTYQLEILFQQAQRIRALGWANTFDLAMAKDRKSFKISYWR
jgi:hypothetical protein